MVVTARLYGNMIKYATTTKPAKWQGSVEDGISVEELIRIIGCTEKEVFSILRNGIYIQKNTVLKDGDFVDFLSLLGGG